MILEQPDQFAWQVFDQKVTHLLRDEYRIRRVSKVTGQTLADLADKMEGVDKQGFLDEIQHYNNAVQQGIKFDPNVKDGRGTTGLEINKSNWANTLDEGPSRPTTSPAASPSPSGESVLIPKQAR